MQIEPTIYYYDSGSVRSEQYFIEEYSLHNELGPAEILYFEDGTIKKVAYAINGYYHRFDGPAIQWFLRSGQVHDEQFYFNKKRYKTLKDLKLSCLI